MKGGKGGYDGIRVWEGQLRMKLRMSLEEYSLIPARERSRLICAMKLDDWFKMLSINEANRKNQSSQLVK